MFPFGNVSPNAPDSMSKGNKPASVARPNVSSNFWNYGKLFAVISFFGNIILLYYCLNVITNNNSNSADLQSNCNIKIQTATAEFKTTINKLKAEYEKTIQELNEKISVINDTRSLQKDKSNIKYKRDDVVCGIITTKKYHSNRAKSVFDTWGAHCGVLLFFSAEPDSIIPVIPLPGTEEGSIINKKVLGMFKYVWEHYPEKKWFMKADDDTFMHLDNLLDLLSEYDHNEKVYIGRAGEWGGGTAYVKYCGGGAGYVLSQRTLRDWYEHIDKCERLPVGEDVTVGKCLRDKIGVTPIFKTGFYHKPPSFFLHTSQGKKDHPEGLSPRPISFHSVQPDEMQTLYYLIYTLHEPLPSSGRWEYPWPASTPTH